MALKRIRKGDQVVVIAGKDKGRRGTVLGVRDDRRVLVEGINLAKKHVKADPNAGVQGGIEEREMPLAESNVMLYNPETGKGDRIGVKWVDASGSRRKVRYFKSNGEVVDA
ncbi:50S ribosomal protein L24 [Salinisphaera sp. P385]|uniref:Large ribosomal subunit protein uL24 n=1 Tax=Spectribacter acetivorans TaxID=3075603 RepID=A0ABU3BA62_9GAMM|nr:50S ribosomal protein L24 [Salinisphaera sp. P385]MDT0619361.1 50S ribosomal protein L24 [Salinisphaera sp. P385]